jgi:hypothetical protein
VAALRGVRAVGVEYNAELVQLSREYAKTLGVSNLATFRQADLFQADLSGATVITLFLLPDINAKLRPRLLELKAGTRIVSNSFDMGDWLPDRRFQAAGECVSWCRGLFWFVPARVSGNWRIPNGELRLEQRYQVISGTARIGGKNVSVSGRLAGEEISFTAGDTQYTGLVKGNIIDGTADGRPFRAARN